MEETSDIKLIRTVSYPKGRDVIAHLTDQQGGDPKGTGIFLMGMMLSLNDPSPTL